MKYDSNEWILISMDVRAAGYFDVIGIGCIMLDNIMEFRKTMCFGVLLVDVLHVFRWRVNSDSVFDWVIVSGE